MANWFGSDRRSELPGNWQSIRRRILAQDNYACQARDEGGTICGAEATDVDHINPGADHSDQNLRSLCGPCHLRKSSSEGGAASAASRREIASRFLRNEQHPGLLP